MSLFRPIALGYRRAEPNPIAYANAIAHAVPKAKLLAEAYDFTDPYAILETWFLDGTSPTQY